MKRLFSATGFHLVIIDKWTCHLPVATVATSVCTNIKTGDGDDQKEPSKNTLMPQLAILSLKNTINMPGFSVVLKLYWQNWHHYLKKKKNHCFLKRYLALIEP